MKYRLKIVSLAALGYLFISPVANAQHLQGIGVGFGANDFYGPQTGQYFTDNVTQANYNILTQTYDTVSKKKFRWDPMMHISYWYQLDRHWDFNLGLEIGNATYPASSKDSNYIEIKKTPVSKNKILVAEIDARANYNILDKRKHLVSPYLFAGISGTHHPTQFGFDIPLGLGGNINLDRKKGNDVFLNLEAGYKLAVTNTDQNHMQYKAGFIFWFKPHYKKVEPNIAEAVAEVLPPPDADHDGVVDSLDKCPTIAGLPEFNGCPDTDGDGVPDNDDECPLVAGSKAFNGCPDTDGDGIPDNKDKCPYVAGTADRGGCPVPDTDHDGIPDDQDACPTVAGTAANHGCPEIRKEVIELVQRQARSVFFETGKSTLKKISYKSLDRIAQVMKDDPTLYITISGYTDNVGKPEFNLKLSDDRANTCRTYLISRGIAEDRITAKGYGETNPVADNKTALGRAQNRRTEFKLRNYK